LGFNFVRAHVFHNATLAQADQTCFGMPIAVCQQVDELLNLCCGYHRPAAFPAWKRDIFARQQHPKAGKA